MITFRHYDRVMQIWLDELPEWCSEESEVAERHQETTKVFFTEACRAAVELFLPIGGRAHYGALGAEFVPGQQGRLLIQVPFSAGGSQPIRPSVAGRIDVVRAGLAHEYVGSVLDGVLSLNPAQLLGQGTLRFCCASYGEAGSSPWLFQRLGRIVVKLLSIDSHSVPEEVLNKLISLELKYSSAKKGS
jgi:hypothetical protein